MGFKFEMGTPIRIGCSGEEGTIVGQAHYEDADDQYLVRYKKGDGCGSESWWTVDALTYPMVDQPT